MLDLEKIYVTHYKPLVERKQRLMEYFDRKKISVEWVENEDVEEGFYDNSPDQWTRKLNIAYPNDQTPPRDLLKTEISVAVKHYECFKKIAASDFKYAMILEDDVVFTKSFVEDYPKYMKDTPPEWDVIFFGNGCFERVAGFKEGKFAYMLEHPKTRCLDSYIIKKTACTKILNTLKPITLPVDFELTYCFIKNNLKTCWWEPSLTSQGSQIDLYKSSIR
tara:strand:+ start:555 stop:1214 length:660 start_codon:yes stop_codon:yes gene_type:complete